MHAFRLAIASALVLGLGACGADEPLVMPDVTGETLDVALSDVERAGFDDEPEVIGGGMFGVVDESNWTVCEQEPGAKKEISERPRLTVDRSCDEAEEPTAEPTETATAEPTETATPEPEPEPAPVVDITVDKLVDKLNSANLGGIELGDQFRLTGELVGADSWGTGASGDFFVYLNTKVGSDLIVFVEESDAKEWQDGTKVEMLVEHVAVTINGETTDGWLKARSAETLTAATTPKPTKEPSEQTPSGPVTNAEAVKAFRTYLDERAAAGVVIAKAVTNVSFKDRVVRVTFDPAAAGMDQATFDQINPYNNPYDDSESLADFVSTVIAFNDDLGIRLRPAIDRIEAVRPDGSLLGTRTTAEIVKLNGLGG